MALSVFTAKLTRQITCSIASHKWHSEPADERSHMARMCCTVAMQRAGDIYRVCFFFPPSPFVI